MLTESRHLSLFYSLKYFSICTNIGLSAIPPPHHRHGQKKSPPEILLLFNTPTVILAAVKAIFYIDRIILNLIKDKIAFRNEHLVIFVRRDIQFIKVRKTLRHLL